MQFNFADLSEVYRMQDIAFASAQTLITAVDLIFQQRQNQPPFVPRVS